MDAHSRTAARLGRLVARNRRRHGLSQEELAALVGIDRQYLSELERGKVTRHLARLIDVLDAIGLELTAEPRTVRLAGEQSDDGA